MKILKIASFLVILLFLSIVTIGLRNGSYSDIHNLTIIYWTEGVLVLLLSLLFLNYSIALRQSKQKDQGNENHKMLQLMVAIRYRVGIIEDEIVIPIVNELIIGHNLNLVHLAFPYNHSIADQHCRLFYENDLMYIETIGDKNLTYLNNLLITGKALLDREDVVRIGDIELQIMWKNIHAFR